MTIHSEDKNKNNNKNINTNINTNKNTNNKNIYLYLFIVIILGLGFYYYNKQQTVQVKPTYKFIYTSNNNKGLTHNNILNMTNTPQSSVIRRSG